MKIVILTSETPSNVWLVNQLLSRHEVVGIVVERRPLALTTEEKHKRRRRMVQRYGLARTFNKLLYNKIRSRCLAGSEAIAVKEQFFAGGAPITYALPVPIQVVGDINDTECIDFIEHHTPDILAVCGTTVIRPEVFTLTPKGAINIHTGITPEYRSADPIFWALYSGEPEKVGVTIHFIDQGIDTGPIIHQDTVPVFAGDTLATIYVRCIRRGAELYSCALSEIADGLARTVRRDGAENRSFRSIDLGIVQYLLFRLRFRRMARSLPRGDRTAARSASEAKR
jgi:methionyl-tRNA formyltransferase